MKKINSGERLKALRSQSGLSQEELSEISNVTVRTIQRIENGQTEPRGDSLKRIAQALKTDVADLAGFEIQIETALQENQWIVRLMIVATFGFLIYDLPLLGILLPGAIWMLYRNKILNVNSTGKQILKFEILWCALRYGIVLYVLSARMFHYALPGLREFSNVKIFIISLYAVNILFCAIMFLKTFGIKKMIGSVYNQLIPVRRRKTA